MLATIERNTTNIVDIINKELKKEVYKNNEESSKLKDHQFLIKTFFIRNKFSDTKGILLYHKMGTGKSILSISIAIEYDKVIIFMNTSLMSNYINDIWKYLKSVNYTDAEINKIIAEKFKFVSLNAFNMKDKIPDIKNSLVIIDESHHVFSGVLNGSENHLALYYKIRTEDSVRLLLMTGTPITNDPYEMIIALNMLVNTTVFSENYDEFNQLILNVNDDVMKRRIETLENRSVGLISYYEQPVDDNYPDDLGLKIIPCEMTKSQTNKYLKLKKIENEKHSKTFKKNKVSTGVSKSTSMGDYKIQTRMICNRDIDEDVSVCIKFNNIYENFLKNKGCNMIYSHFINNNGLNGISTYLSKKGYTLYNINQSNQKRCFAIIQGDITLENRNTIQNIFNSEENKYGDIISFLLVSSTGSEGLDLKHIRAVHILEPYWNMSKINQIKARAIRYKSHAFLPKDHRSVVTYLYLSTLKIEDHFTTDEEINQMALDKQIRIDYFLNTMKRISLDCIFHHTDCFQCVPSNTPLFKMEFITDINIPNPCKTFDSDKIELEHVKDNIYEDKKTGDLYKKIKNKYIKL